MASAALGVHVGSSLWVIGPVAVGIEVEVLVPAAGGVPGVVVFVGGHHPGVRGPLCYSGSWFARMMAVALVTGLWDACGWDMDHCVVGHACST